MHIECFKNNGVDYLRIAESIYVKELGRQKKVIVKNIGPLSHFDDGKPDFLERLRAQFKNGEVSFDGISYSDKRKPKLTFEIDPDKNYIEMKNIGYFFLEKYFTGLEIDKVLFLEKSRSKIEYDIAGLARLLVFGRILNPQSKKATFRDRGKYLYPVTSSADIKEIYRALDVLDKKSESIQARMNTKIAQSPIGRKTDLTYYDVTNYYFETMYGDDDVYELDAEGKRVLDDKGKPVVAEKGLRKKGVGKDGKPNPLVSMGLFIDNNGIPVSYRIFPGNTQDKTTFKDMIKTSLPKQDSGKIIVVADNGMNAQENMYLLTADGNGYIITKSVKRSWNAKPGGAGRQRVKDWALDETGYECTFKNDVLVFKSKSRIYERTLKDKEGNSITIREKEIIYWSKKHYEREVHQNNKFLEYLESCKEHPDKLKDKQRKSQEFIKVIQTDKKTGEVLKTKAVVVLLEEKIQKYKETMGFYSIVTSETDMPDKDVINKYHGLSRIEDSFRIIKSDLEGRPIYVWTEKHINAHFLICFIALTIIRLIQHRVLKFQGKDTLNVDGWEEGITAENLKKALSGYEACSDNNGTCLFSKMPPEVELMCQASGIEFMSGHTEDALREFRKRIKASSI